MRRYLIARQATTIDHKITLGYFGQRSHTEIGKM
jgi:hypothetical protein